MEPTRMTGSWIGFRRTARLRSGGSCRNELPARYERCFRPPSSGLRGLADRFVQYSGRLYVSSVALAELSVWAFAKTDPHEQDCPRSR